MLRAQGFELSPQRVVSIVLGHLGRRPVVATTAKPLAGHSLDVVVTKRRTRHVSLSRPSEPDVGSRGITHTQVMLIEVGVPIARLVFPNAPIRGSLHVMRVEANDVEALLLCFFRNLAETIESRKLQILV